MSTRPQGVVHPFGSLDGAPEIYLTPVTRPSVEQALMWCRQLATTHYENFHVTSIFLPKRLAAALLQRVCVLQDLGRSGG